MSASQTLPALSLTSVLAVSACLTVVMAQHSVTVRVPDFYTSSDTGCINATVGLSTSILLQYRLVESSTTAVQLWTTVVTIPSNRDSQIMETIYLNDTAEGLQFRLVQFEHGGGGCNCWSHEDLVVTLDGAGGRQPTLDDDDEHFCYTNLDTVSELFCDTSASVARGEITMAFYFDNSSSAERCPGGSGMMLISDQGPSLPQNCANIIPRIEISYQLTLEVNGGCRGVSGIDEAIEFAIRNVSNNGPWIPLRLNCYSNNNDNNNNCGTNNPNRTVRGYTVRVSVSGTIARERVFICGDLLLDHVEEVQFRWMAIASRDGNGLASHDVWGLSNVTATWLRDDRRPTVLFEDTFGSPVLNSTVWMEPRRGTVHCTDACLNTDPCQGHYLTFGAYNDMGDNVTIALTQNFHLDRTISLPTTSPPIITTGPPGTTTGPPTTDPPTTVPPTTDPPTTDPPTTDPPTTGPPTTDPPTTNHPTTDPPTTDPPTTDPPTTGPPTTDPPTTDPPTTVPPTTTSDPPTTLSLTESVTLQQVESSIRQQIDQSPELRAVSNADPLEAINLLQNMTLDPEKADSEDISVVLYLLGDILNRFNSTGTSTSFIEGFLDVSTTLTAGPDGNQGEVDIAIVGGSFLDILDRYVLEVFPMVGNRSTGTITLLTKQVSAEENLSISTINSEDFANTVDTSKMSIQIPSELVRAFADESGVVRTVSFLYDNISNLFPEEFQEKNSTIGSGIVSTALQCGDKRCPTDNLQLNSNVTITIEHSEEVERQLGSDKEVLCVFWKFSNASSEDGILSTGQWSDEGCFRNKLSNNSVTVCECDHLTHFAILLSATPLNSTLSLEIIGYVGVAVSLVAMALTIVTFLLLKPLRTMRNFIHINLCISLGIAQIIFVAAVDTASGSDDDVPTHCQAVAVLLHYFFLVSFMWMLMEGVFLYVTLVRVFVKRKKLYMLAFAVASYGVPLLYLGALTLPLGFALQTQPNYGYSTACFLNPATHFIWAFIVPVVVIIFINFGFFIMAATIMWRHQKKQIDKTRLQNIRNWMRAAVSLVVIMGLTWILGVLIVEVDQLLPLAYIYTILVAFQGLFIFLIFVLLSKQVREAYTKWWRAKVNESDILSRYFGESFSSRMGATTVSKEILDSNEKNALELKGAKASNASMVSEFENGLVISNKNANL